MIRVAIVEDSETIRESLMHFVQTDPECRCVFACATAEEALAGIPRHQPEVVLMDIQLPKLSGIDCTAQIKKYCRQSRSSWSLSMKTPSGFRRRCARGLAATC